MNDIEMPSSESAATRPQALLPALFSAVAALSAPALVLATLLLGQPQNTPPALDPQVTQAAPEQLELVCLDQHIDPFDNDKTPTLDVWTFPTSLGQNTGRTLSVNTTTTSEFFALAAPVQSGGELRTLNMLPCSQARVTHWFAAGRTTAGHDTSIRVVNPSSRPAVVHLRFWTSAGPATARNHSVTIPAGGASTISPGYYVPEETRLAVQLTSDGPGIGAWMQVSTMDGEVPQGTTWFESTQPALTHTLVGVGNNSVLRVANPSESDTTIHLTWTTPQEQTPIPGGRVELASGSVTDISLPTHSDGAASVSITSDHEPILAHAWSRTVGEPWVKTDKPQVSWASATSYTPVHSLRHAVIPTSRALEKILQESAQSPLIRETSIPTPSGMTIDTVTLQIYNPQPSPVSVTLSGSNHLGVTIPPGRIHTLDLASSHSASATHTPADTGQSLAQHSAAAGLMSIEASDEVHMAVVVEAHSPTGPLRAVMPIRAESLATASIPVLIRR